MENSRKYWKSDISNQIKKLNVAEQHKFSELVAETWHCHSYRKLITHKGSVQKYTFGMSTEIKEQFTGYNS